MRRLLPLCLSLAACGPGVVAPFTPAGECVTDGGTRFELQTARACSYYEGTAEALAAELAREWHPTDAQNLLAGLTVYVHDGIQFPCTMADGGVVTGCQWWGEPGSVIEVSETAGAALHETLHAMQERIGIAYPASYAHEGWTQNGWLSEGDRFYWRLDAQFHAEFGGESPALAPGAQ